MEHFNFEGLETSKIDKQFSSMENSSDHAKLNNQKKKLYQIGLEEESTERLNKESGLSPEEIMDKYEEDFEDFERMEAIQEIELEILVQSREKYHKFVLVLRNCKNFSLEYAVSTGYKAKKAEAKKKEEPETVVVENEEQGEKALSEDSASSSKLKSDYQSFSE
jgi:hypothetical protein